MLIFLGMMMIPGMNTRSSCLVTALALCIAELLLRVAAVHEALLFASPQDINQRTKKALKVGIMYIRLMQILLPQVHTLGVGRGA